MKKHFTISVIISVHTAENYLEDMIRSILYQTLNFEQKIQLIIVGDCSGGMCEEICKKYKLLYPENVMYLCLDEYSNKNASYGASVKSVELADIDEYSCENARRNTGMKYAAGEYINFLYAGNMWSLNAFEKAVDFFETCGEDIDLISADSELIEAVREKIPFNQKMTAHKIIDIKEQYSSILYRSSSCIMRAETVQNYLSEEHQGSWGDLLLIYRTVLHRQKYGMLSSEVIHYCHAECQETVFLKPDAQRDLQTLFDGLCQESVKQNGCVLQMIQYFMACVLGEMFQQTIAVSDGERKMCCHGVFDKILQQIEDRYLLEAENIDVVVRKALAAYKHGVDIREEIHQIRLKEQQYQESYQYFDKTYKNNGVLRDWFLLHIQGKKVSEYFNHSHYQHIAVYGMAELGQFLVAELRNFGLDVKYGIDRRAGTVAAEIPVLTLEDELPLVDVVIVTAVYYFNQIADSLKDRLECPVISIEDVLYSIP